MRTLNNLNKTEGGQATFFGSVQGVACTHSVCTDQKVVELQASADYLHSLFWHVHVSVTPDFLLHSLSYWRHSANKNVSSPLQTNRKTVSVYVTCCIKCPWHVMKLLLCVEETAVMVIFHPVRSCQTNPGTKCVAAVLRGGSLCYFSQSDHW